MLLVGDRYYSLALFCSRKKYQSTFNWNMKAILNIYTKRNVIEGFGYTDGGGHENLDIFDGSN